MATRKVHPPLHPVLEAKLDEILDSSHAKEEKLESIATQIRELDSDFKRHIEEDRDQFDSLGKDMARLKERSATEAKWAGRIWGLVTGILAAVGTWVAEKIAR